MGNKRRILRGMKQSMALADTKMSINGCQVLMGHPDPAHVTATAKQFKGHLADVIARAGCVNMGDIYNNYVDVQKKIELGDFMGLRRLNDGWQFN